MAELGAAELLDVETLLLGDIGGDVAFFFGVHDVQARDGFHAELSRVRLGQVLGVVRAVKVFSVEGRLGTSHIATDDEVRAAVVLTNDHVLNSFARTRHVHGVREVGPANLRVLHLFREDDVRLVSHQARDVVVLGRTHGRVNEAHGVLTDVFRVQSASEELVVRAVHRVAALERHDILTRGQPRAHLGGRRARKRSLRNVQTLNLTTDVILATLHGDHRHAGMLDGARPVAHLRLFRLIRLPLRLHRQHADVLALILEQHSVARLGVLAIRVQHDRQPEQQLAPLQPHRLHAVFVLVLVHEPSQRREPPRAQQLDVARVSIRQLERPRARRDRPRLRPVVLEHQIHQRAAVRRDQPFALRRERPLAR